MVSITEYPSGAHVSSREEHKELIVQGRKGLLGLQKERDYRQIQPLRKGTFIVQRRSWSVCMCIIGGLMLSDQTTLLCTNNKGLIPGRDSSSFSQQSLVSCSTLSMGKVPQNCQLPMLLRCKLIDTARRKGKVEMMQFHFS